MKQDCILHLKIVMKHVYNHHKSSNNKIYKEFVEIMKKEFILNKTEILAVLNNA
jgi:hypothetical protein